MKKLVFGTGFLLKNERKEEEVYELRKGCR